MSTGTYIRFEVTRAFRNRRFFAFSVAFPLILFFVIAAPNRNEHDLGGSGIDAPLYYMVGLTAFGTMNAVLGSGARIASERSIGWNRQLRLTPLSTHAYFRTKVLIAYLTALVTIYLLVFLAAVFLLWIVGEWNRRRRERRALRYRLRCVICAFEFEDRTPALLPRCPRCGSLNERLKPEQI